MKTESGKLIMIFWCIYIFMACGFEHSIANMSVMAVGLLNGAGVEGVSIAGYFHNLLWVTLGNIAGGALLVAFPYYIIQKRKKIVIILYLKSHINPGHQHNSLMPRSCVWDSLC